METFKILNSNYWIVWNCDLELIYNKNRVFTNGQLLYTIVYKGSLPYKVSRHGCGPQGGPQTLPLTHQVPVLCQRVTHL